MTHEQFVRWLEERGAFCDGVAWVRRHKHTPESAWETCPRGDWMLWLLGVAGPTVEQARGAAEVARRCAGRASAGTWAGDKARTAALAAAREANTERAVSAAERAARAAALDAEWAERAEVEKAVEAHATELAACAADCRELIHIPNLEKHEGD